MNLIEAVKTGKPFRRKAWTHNDYMAWSGGHLAYGGGELVWASCKTRCHIAYRNDILIDDYEIFDEEKK